MNLFIVFSVSHRSPTHRESVDGQTRVDNSLSNCSRDSFPLCVGCCRLFDSLAFNIGVQPGLVGDDDLVGLVAPLLLVSAPLPCFPLVRAGCLVQSWTFLQQFGSGLFLLAGCLMFGDNVVLYESAHHRLVEKSLIDPGMFGLGPGQ